MSQDLILDNNLEEQKNMARILYAVHGLTFLLSLGMLSILPLIVNYIKRPETEGTIVHSHHSWMIRSFWWFAVWMLVGGIFLVALGWLLGLGVFLAWVVWSLAWIWKAYRLIKGFIDLNSNRAMSV